MDLMSGAMRAGNVGNYDEDADEISVCWADYAKGIGTRDYAKNFLEVKCNGI
jgi:hypothetical protein